MKKFFLFIYFLVAIFGIILARDIYTPKCAGANCLYIPIIPWGGNCTCTSWCAPGWPYVAQDTGSDSDYAYLNCQEMHVNVNKINNSVAMLSRIKFGSMSTADDGGEVHTEIAYNSGFNYYFWRVYVEGVDNNDEAEAGAVVLDWDNDYGI